VELRKPLHAALKALARWRDDGDVALAVLHAQAMAANDPGWTHCSAVLLRGVARAVNACAREVERCDGEPESLGEAARNLALAAQVLAGLAAGLRRSARAAQEAKAEGSHAAAPLGTPKKGAAAAEDPPGINVR